ncbi:hypothetical protein AB0M28_05455 [Streptomyces sp. NPDC051940]|uniref:hypothetical protein n=1 Tax=Streptomyces sp. NPDC051940 TaxID=3155675 RepID=UPI00342E2527
MNSSAQTRPRAPEAGPPPPDETAAKSSAAARPAARRWLRPVAAAVLAAVTLTGGGLLFRAHQINSGPGAENTALTDTDATTRVIGDVSGALSKVFSYSPADTDATARDAEQLLDGKAAEQYERLFAQVRERVAEQKLTLTTEVVRAGVSRLDGGSAQLLVFLDQTTQRADGKPSTVAAQLTVTARFTDGQWRITDMTSR